MQHPAAAAHGLSNACPTPNASVVERLEKLRTLENSDFRVQRGLWDIGVSFLIELT